MGNTSAENDAWTRREPLVIVGLAAVTGIVYLAWSVLAAGELGFPLDDSWIHQVFARSLAETGEMAYNPGEPTAGSTAPLWTVLLALARLLPVDPRWSAYLYGMFFLAGSAWLMSRIWRRLCPSAAGLVAVAPAVLLLMDWHMAWAALSGMETCLFIFLSLLLVYLTMKSAAPWEVGLVAGLLTVTRPEGVVLATLCWARGNWDLWSEQQRPEDEVASRQGRRPTLARAVRYSLAWGVAFLLPLAPYLAFSWNVSGSLLPNTFYAKVATYGRAGLLGLLSFFGETAVVLVLGPLALLAPGLVVSAALVWRRSRDALLLWGWPLALLALYAWRLPATYHHARYEMPVLPFLILLGWWGIVGFPGRQQLRLLSRVYPWLLAALVAGSWVRGVGIYGGDVRFINVTQVSAARWLRDNTPPTAVVGTHDIGAIGYFSGRRILDTAGLITPEVVPWIHDQPHLLEYLRQQRVGYVAQFTVWYPQISAALKDREVYRVHDAAVAAAGGDDFVIYQTGW